MKKVVLFLIIILVIAFGFFVVNNDSGSVENENVEIKSPETEEGIISSNWGDSELTDISTGETFTINSLNGKKVLVESFAVWCPTCTAQQKEIKKLHEEIGDEVISISLNTDPNENEEIVKSHIESNGFDWYYAISPSGTTKSLIDQFGIGIVNAPSAPVILICENGSARKLPSGIKTSEKLKEEINKGC